MPLWLVERDASGNGALRGFAEPTTPPPPPPDPVPGITTLFGYNTNDADSPLSERLGWWDDRAPVVRRYQSGFIGQSWTITTAVAPEKRCSYSFKPSGAFSAAALAGGSGNSQLIDFVESIPGGWYVPLTFLHEVNDNIRNGQISVSNYRAIYDQFRTALDSATLAKGTVVHLVPNFMAYRVADTPTYFSDSWVPPRGVGDILTWDIYGNPGHFTSATGSNKYGTATGSGYGTTYPEVPTRFRDMFAATERLGYADSWGILEINSPARSWDTGENGRKLWHQDAIAHINAPPMTGRHKPKICLAWEAPSGVNWDQSYGRLSGNPLTIANVWKPWITGTPVGGV